MTMDGRSLPDHRPSHRYNAGTEHVGFSPTRQALLSPSAKRRDTFRGNGGRRAGAAGDRGWCPGISLGGWGEGAGGGQGGAGLEPGYTLGWHICAWRTKIIRVAARANYRVSYLCVDACYDRALLGYLIF